MVKKATQKSGTKRRALTCSDCGFTAAHAMGLGRHRTARHGVLSQRELRERESLGKQGAGTDIARLERRIRDLERRHERLVRNLSGLGTRLARQTGTDK
jgi:hypothetical protein